jgi:hypothetical protein
MRVRHLSNLVFFWIACSVMSMALLLYRHSEAQNALLLGYSGERLLLAAGLFAFILLLGIIALLSYIKPVKIQSMLFGVSDWLLQNDNLYLAAFSLLLLTLLSMGAAIFTWLMLPAALRPLFTLMAVIFLSTLVAVALIFRQSIPQKTNLIYRRLLEWREASTSSQKKTLTILSLFGLVYFLAFIPVNLQNTQSLDAFNAHGGDEVVMYPILMQMFEPGETFSARLYHLFIYEDYHYGYPFYVVSALAVLPARLLYGPDFAEQVQFTLPILRQLVSVLPMVLSAILLAYMITKFKQRFYAIAVFLFVLLIPGVVNYNVLFWHPDALAILFVVLTVFFLQRDKGTFRYNWVLAAIACGLATSIRLLGFFAGLAVAYVLLEALIQHKASFKKIVLAGLIFLLVMGAVILVSSPFLFMPTARARFVEILAEKQQEMKFGYNEPDPENIYRTGWEVWLPFLEKHYGEGFFLLLTALGLGITSFMGDRQREQRLMALWVMPSLGYLIYFVAVKSYQYLLPPMVPFLATAFNLPLLVHENGISKRPSGRFYRLLEALLLGVIAIQVVLWVRVDWQIYMTKFR